MTTRPAYIHRMFSAIADRYDLLNTLLSFNRDKYWRRFTVSSLGLKGDEVILDVATGTGKLAQELVKGVGAKGKVVGIDFCKRMLYIAKNKSPNTELALATSESLPFPDNTFDCATIAFALRNVPDVEKTLRETTRVVKRGGKVICLEFSRPRHRLFRKIHQLYLFRILPLIGWVLSRDREAYIYLPRSIAEFYEPSELKRIMEHTGLKDTHFHPLTWGIVTIHAGIKS